VGELLQASDGAIYGTTLGGFGAGTIFRIPAPGYFETLYFFSGSTDGGGPLTGLVQGTDGTFYGTTQFARTAMGMNAYGTVFAWTPGGSLTTLHLFTFFDGSAPAGNLIQGADGDFYGTTSGGGTNGYGSIFKVTAAGVFTDLHHFESPDGMMPAGVVEGGDGTLYGSTIFGGTSGLGTAFSLTPAGTLTTIHTFAGGADGFGPRTGFIRARDGDFYGATYGANTIVRMTSAGNTTTVHTFSGSAEGANPWAPLFEASDGSFYGTTVNGGPVGKGSVFKVTSAGSLTTLHFFGGTDGAYPVNGLVQASDGDFYGMTRLGGASDRGTVFKITSTGAFALLHSFSGGGDGEQPYGSLIQASDGDFYGTTSNRGPTGGGTVFRMTAGGTLTTIASFNSFGSPGSGGTSPQAGLLQGSDGDLYGTTSGGGASRYGTVFKLAIDGTLTTLHDFTGTDGAYPQGALIQASDGRIYGATSDGGPGSGGVVFRLTLVFTPLSVSASASGPTTFCPGGSVLLSAVAAGGSGTYASYQWYRDGTAIPERTPRRTRRSRRAATP